MAGLLCAGARCPWTFATNSFSCFLNAIMLCLPLVFAPQFTLRHTFNPLNRSNQERESLGIDQCPPLWTNFNSPDLGVATDRSKE